MPDTPIIRWHLFTTRETLQDRLCKLLEEEGILWGVDVLAGEMLDQAVRSGVVLESCQSKD